MENSRIFFSYSRTDGAAFALKLAGDLRNAGADIWVDQLNIQPGKRWDIEVEKALTSAACVLFVATEQSTTSTNVLDEVYYALEENKDVTPVIAAGCKIPFRLRRLQFIDFTTSYDAALKHLLKFLTGNHLIHPSTQHTAHEDADSVVEAIANWLVDEFKKDETMDLRKDPSAWPRLKEAAKKAKAELSASTATEIYLPYITAANNIPKHLRKTLTQKTFTILLNK